MAKGTTNKEMTLERWSHNAWNYERSFISGFERWMIIAHVVGTAGNMSEYCFAWMYRYEDGTEELVYYCEADTDDLCDSRYN